MAETFEDPGSYLEVVHDAERVEGQGAYHGHRVFIHPVLVLFGHDHQTRQQSQHKVYRPRPHIHLGRERVGANDGPQADHTGHDGQVT